MLRRRLIASQGQVASLQGEIVSMEQLVGFKQERLDELERISTVTAR